MQPLAHTKKVKPNTICASMGVKNAPHANSFVQLLTQIARKQMGKRKVVLV